MQYIYDGTPNGPDKYTVWIVKNGKRQTNITDSVTLSQVKHTDCGEWYVKVTAKSGSGYTGSKMVKTFTVYPKNAYLLSAGYNKKTKKTTVTFKMPKLKKGRYEFVLYSGKEFNTFDYDCLTKAQKKKIIKRTMSKKKAWNGQTVKIVVPKKLSKGTYHVYVDAEDTGYTNRTGKTKYLTEFGTGPTEKKIVVK